MAYHTPMWNELRHWPMVVKLRVVRALCGMTKRETAQLLGISERTYSGYETGERPIPYRSWQLLDYDLERIVADREQLEQARRKSFVSNYGGVYVPASE
jgi:DNA-binding XRE family transcriptional regulator